MKKAEAEAAAANDGQAATAYRWSDSPGGAEQRSTPWEQVNRTMEKKKKAKRSEIPYKALPGLGRTVLYSTVQRYSGTRYSTGYGI